MQIAILEIRHANGDTETREMVQGTLSIGSEMGEILLGDPEVAGSHGHLRLLGMALTYTDVGSSSGSFVNDERVTAPINVVPGKTIALGKSSITLRGLATRRSTRTEVTVKIHRSMFGLPPTGEETPVRKTPRPAPVIAPEPPSMPSHGSTLPVPRMLARISPDGRLSPVGELGAATVSPLNQIHREGPPAPPPFGSPAAVAVAEVAEPPPLLDISTAPAVPNQTAHGELEVDIDIEPDEAHARPTVAPAASAPEEIAPPPMLEFGGSYPSHLGQQPAPPPRDTWIRWGLLATAAAASAAYFVWAGDFALSTTPQRADRGQPASSSSPTLDAAALETEEATLTGIATDVMRRLGLRSPPSEPASARATRTPRAKPLAKSKAKDGSRSKPRSKRGHKPRPGGKAKSSDRKSNGS